MKNRSMRKGSSLRAAGALLGGLGLVALGGCGGGGSSDSDDVTLSGRLSGIPTAGLAYRTDTLSGITDEQGGYRYRSGETVRFAVGDLDIGAASGAGTIDLDALAEAEQDESARLTNTAVLLQTLDHDGDLNNGIEITGAATEIVSRHADGIVLDQEPAQFTEDGQVVALLDALNAVGEPVFDDTDPRPRPLHSQQDAMENLQRALSDRRSVETEYGALRGFATEDGRAWSWYGVPYAAPPLGERRWQPPASPRIWEGTRDAIAWGDQCAQLPFYEDFGEGGMSEDCLYLNVTVPKGYEGEKLPVMVWFHGGGFRILTGNTKAFNHTSLPSEGVILVSVVHRLGPFGYLAHPALTAESEHNSSGNYGQLDLVAALQWVQDNIDAFGGDADNVTIFGESGGGGKSLSLLHSPLASGLFHRAIIQSGMSEPGDVVNSVPLEVQEEEGERFVDALELSGDGVLSESLRQVPWTELAEKAEENGLVTRPNIDGWYKTQAIRDAFEAGEHNDVPIMAGANTGDYPRLIEGLLWYMPWVADANQSDLFAYVFDYVPAGWRVDDVPAYHGIELVSVFDYEGSYASHYLLGLTEHEDPTPAKFATVDAPGSDPDEHAMVSGRTLAMWAAFARSGNPSLPDLEFPAYTSENDVYMDIGLDQQAAVGLEEALNLP